MKIRYYAAMVICLGFGFVIGSPPKEYCSADYCITEGQTLEQIGIN